MSDGRSDLPGDSGVPAILTQTLSGAHANDRIVATLLGRENCPLVRLFTDFGSRPPGVYWDPGLSALSAPMLRGFAASMAPLQNPDNTVNRDMLNLQDLGALRDWTVVIEDDKGPDGAASWRYSAYGDGVTSFIKRDLTGKSPHALDRHIGVFFDSVYAACQIMRKPVLTVHQPPPQIFVYEWRRLIYPICDGVSTAEAPLPVTGCVALVFPDQELGPGLEVVPDPLLLMDKNKIVRHANRHARELFDAVNFGPWDRSLFDYSGIELDIVEPPDVLARTGRAVTHGVRQVSGSLLLHMDVQVSGLFHNGHPYYLLTVRLPA